jgi:hypothetical protein
MVLRQSLKANNHARGDGDTQDWRAAARMDRTAVYQTRVCPRNGSVAPTARVENRILPSGFHDEEHIVLNTIDDRRAFGRLDVFAPDSSNILPVNPFLGVQVSNAPIAYSETGVRGGG